ncbi:MAG: outer membrane protein assembly factor BamA [Verrucomicrobiales bacterium]|nr:outer membrane protein assembly factor BamA [Verrucomicrobiales bacterium]
MTFTNTILRGLSRAVPLKLLTAGAIFVAATVGTQAQNGKTVKTIEVQYVGAKTVSEERILTRMSTKVGDSLSIAKVDEDVKTLYESGEVDNVRVLSEPQDGGVKLIVVVQSRALYGGVQFEGNSLFSDSKLAKSVELSVNKAIDEGAIRKARQDIQDMYRKKGYPETTVGYRIGAPNAQGYSSVIFGIDEGSQGVLRNVSFVGNNSKSGSEIKEVMKQKEKSVMTHFGGGGRTDSESLAVDSRAIEDFYRDNGYLDARVVNVAKVPVDEKYNDVVFTIEEGEVYSVAGIDVAGVQSLSMESDILPYLKTGAGKPFSGTALRDDIKLINDQYGASGYVDAQIIPRLEGAGPRQVAVKFNVNEGRPYKIGQIHIEGNTKTKDHVIRRELPLLPGEALDVTTMEITERRLQNMNYFETVDVTPVDTSYIDEKDLIIRVTEKPTGSLNFGAGFSSIDSVTGFVEVTQANFDLFDPPNFVGGGQRFRLSIRGGNERKDASISITEPYFMGERLALTAEGFYRDLLFLSDQYDQTTYGGALSLRRALGEHMYGSLEYRYEVIDIDAAASASAFYQSEDGKFNKSSLKGDITYDDRDNLFVPRSGQKISAGYEYAGLGGNVEDSIATVSASKHYTLPGDLILNGTARYRYSANGDHLFTRHYLGGANNLRGFDYREVGPKDAATLDGVGGKQAWNATFEATYPIVEKIRIAGFYDVGEVSDGPANSVGGGVNSDWGIGLRLFLMGNAPIRLDYAFPLQTDEFNDDGGQFNFTIGTQF